MRVSFSGNIENGICIVNQRCDEWEFYYVVCCIFLYGRIDEVLPVLDILYMYQYFLLLAS